MVGSVIKSLILQGKRVIIPDLGAFLIKDAAAAPILSSDNVTFSPFLRYNDGFLEAEVAHAAGIHKDEAAKRVAEYVVLIKKSLFEDNAVFEIGGVGYLLKDDKGGVRFTITLPSRVQQPERHNISHSADQAAPAQSSPSAPVEEKREPAPEPAKPVEPVAHIEVKQEVRQQVAEQPRRTPDHPSEHRQEMSTQPAKAKDEDLNETETKGSINNIPPSKRFSKSLLYGFLFLLATLFVLNLFWGDIFGDHSGNGKPKIVLEPLDQEKAEQEKAKVDANENVQDEISKQVVSTVEDRVKAATDEESKPADNDKKAEKKAPEPKKEATPKESAKKEEPKTSPAKEAKGGDAYEIVLGAFGSEANAQKHVQELSKKGIKAKMVAKGTMYKVVSGTFGSYEEAQKEQSRAKQAGFDGWISRK